MRGGGRGVEKERMRGGGGILGEVGSGNPGRRPRVPARKVNCFSSA